MSRYIIIGAGAVGATVGAELHRAGVDVVLVARGAHLEALRERGLRYLRPDGEHVLPVPVASGPADLTLTEDDVLVLATKSQDTAAALETWAGAAHRPLLTLQNGLENERLALRLFPTVIGGVIWTPASYLTAGEVVSPAAPTPAVVWLGRYPEGAGEPAENIAGDLRRAGLVAEVVPDIQRWKAGKLLGNLVNGLDALYPAGELRDAALAALREEGRAVLAAAGIEPADLKTGTSADLSGFVPREVPGHPRQGHSTWQSLARGTTTETDYLNGEIVLLGRLHGVPAPLNQAVQERVRRAVAEGTAPGSLDEADLAALLPADDRRDDVLIDVAELHRRLAGADAPVVLDVRWALGDPHGAEHYREGHIPGAIYVDLDTELAGPHSPGAGRHPFPTIEKFQADVRRWGVNRRGGVVVYDNSGGLAAARAWWLLRWAGVGDVRILDGGLAAWAEAGHFQATGEARPRPASDIVLEPGQLPTLTADEAAELARTGTLVDARAGERYRGEAEPIDPRAGHIPGAVSLPTAANLDGGRFLATAALRERFAGLTGPVGVYCGSGVTAAHEIAALAVAGIDAALYPGSWSAWSSDPDRPAATGPDPS
jgi:thiosulfate/3-mercaptopyruvate sulfurtransferase